MGRLNRNKHAVQQYGWMTIVIGKILWSTKIWKKHHKFSLTCVELKTEVSFES